MLDDLSSPAGKGFEPLLEFFILPAHFDGLPPLGRAGTGEGETALLRLIGAGLFDDFRVKHDHVGALVVKGNDPFVHADHVGCHAHTAGLVVLQGFQQVGSDGKVVRGGRLCLLSQKGFVFTDISNHN